MNLASKHFFEQHEINDHEFLFRTNNEEKDDSYKCIGFISYERDNKEKNKGKKERWEQRDIILPHFMIFYQTIGIIIMTKHLIFLLI